MSFDDKGLSYETKEWILRYGCRNDIGLHFTACECAIKGGLVQYLSEFSEEPVNKIPGAVDEEMTEGICDIIDGLLAGESVENADGLSELPNARGLESSFRWVYDNDGFTGSEARLENLKNAMTRALMVK